MLTTIKLLGVLGEEFVEEIKLCVNSVTEAMWALQNIFPSFKSWVIEQGQHGLAYQVFVGDEQIEEKGLGLPSGGEAITVIPVIMGSGSSGLLKIILGVALIGLGISGVGLLGLSSTSLLLAGGALLLTGIAGSLQPKNTNKNSLIYGNTLPTQAVGGGKPLCFGIHMVNPITISAYIKTTKLAS